MTRVLLSLPIVVLAVQMPGAAPARGADTAPEAAQQQTEPQQAPDQPIFRATVDLVTVDVSVTGRGDQPVTDLQAEDFIVTEDDVPQTVETVQFIQLDGQRTDDSGESLEIRGPEQARVEAAKDDVRLFTLFLDDYHIDRLPMATLPLRRALESFVEQLQPTDLVALMDPLTTLDSLRFTRDKAELLDRIRTFEGRRGQLLPVRSAVEEAQLAQRNVWELRAGVTLSALEAVVTHLGGLREGRKSVIFVSQGPPVGLPGSPLYPRLEAALRAANRGNVTVHVLDPRPLGSAPLGGSEALRRLSSETGGRSLVNINNHDNGIRQIFGDASAYYLIGYSPTRTLADGKFHRINVRVRRPGVRVTARRGYWAPTEAEANPTPAPPPDPTLTRALRELVVVDETRLVDLWIGATPGEDEETAVAVSWDPGPKAPDEAPASLDVEPLTRTGTPLAEPQRIRSGPSDGDMPGVARFDLEPGPVTLRLTARSAGGAVLDRWTQAINVPDYQSANLRIGTPRVYRTRNLLETRAFQADDNPTPTASRRFRRTDRLVIDVPYLSDVGTPELSASLGNREGQTLTELPMAEGPEGVARVVLPLTSLAPATYTVRVELSIGGATGAEMVAFTVSP